MKKDKTYLFIDGSNLYAGQYEFFGPDKYINFCEFIKEIERSLKISFDKIYFYASYSPKPDKLTKKQKLYLKNEGLFYKGVRITPKVAFFTGYRSKTSGKEKEVDVKLAVDIVDFAHRNYYNHVFLMSGDADFMHALYIARNLDKKISILALQNRIPLRFTYNFYTYLLLFEGFRNKLKFSSKQKIKTVIISKKNIVKEA